MQNLLYLIIFVLLIIAVLSLYFLIKMKDRLKDLGTKLNLLEDQQTKDKQSIIETLNSQYTDVMLAIKELQTDVTIMLNTVEPEERKELDDSNYYEKAKAIVLKTGKASATLLQRKMQIFYSQAARLLDTLEKDGIIGPTIGSNPREVLAKHESLDYLHGDEQLLPEAIEFVSQLKTISATKIQRRFKIGYARSAGLLDILEEKGIIGPANGINPRKVLSK